MGSRGGWQSTKKGPWPNFAFPGKLTETDHCWTEPWRDKNCKIQKRSGYRELYGQRMISRGLQVIPYYYLQGREEQKIELVRGEWPEQLGFYFISLFLHHSTCSKFICVEYGGKSIRLLTAWPPLELKGSIFLHIYNPAQHTSGQGLLKEIKSH